MKFSELVRLLEANGFSLLREKGSVRYYRKPAWPRIVRVDYHGSKEVPTGTCHAILKAAGIAKPYEEVFMLVNLSYSLVIEATDEPDFFGFWSPDLEGFSGIGHSVEDCLYQAKWGMKEHVEVLLAEQRLPVPPPSLDPVVTHSQSDHCSRGLNDALR